MGGGGQVEIVCPQCGQEALLIREPVYEGFEKVGERRKCSACGYFFADDEEPGYKLEEHVEIFGESDRSQKTEVFEDGERGILCRYCRHYVLNPFTQWCGLHRREVEATDTCDSFEKMDDEGREEPVL